VVPPRLPPNIVVNSNRCFAVWSQKPQTLKIQKRQRKKMTQSFVTVTRLIHDRCG
jgi:hypothetical protein